MSIRQSRIRIAIMSLTFSVTFLLLLHVSSPALWANTCYFDTDLNLDGGVDQTGTTCSLVSALYSPTGTYSPSTCGDAWTEFGTSSNWGQILLTVTLDYNISDIDGIDVVIVYLNDAAGFGYDCPAISLYNWGTTLYDEIARGPGANMATCPNAGYYFDSGTLDDATSNTYFLPGDGTGSTNRLGVLIQNVGGVWFHLGAVSITFYYSLLEVDLMDYYALPGDENVTIFWTTEAETNNAGFNIYRSTEQDGIYKKINDTLIQGNQYSYSFQDSTVGNGKTYYYRLEDVDLHGNAREHYPIWGTPLQPDIDKSGVINNNDLATITDALNTRNSDHEFPAAADLNSDGVITLKDLYIFLDYYDLTFGIIPDYQARIDPAIQQTFITDHDLDFDQDGMITKSDFSIIALNYMITNDDPAYNAQADLDDNGIIDRLDMEIFSGYFTPKAKLLNSMR